MSSPRLVSHRAEPHALTDEQRKRVIDSIAKVIPVLPPCELCRNDGWSLNSRIVSPTMLSPSADRYQIDDSRIHPSALIQCTHCGNSKFLSLAVLAIDPYEEPEL